MFGVIASFGVGYLLGRRAVTPAQLQEAAVRGAYEAQRLLVAQAEQAAQADMAGFHRRRHSNSMRGEYARRGMNGEYARRTMAGPLAASLRSATRPGVRFNSTIN